jgi:hypothetical protein
VHRPARRRGRDRLGDEPGPPSYSFDVADCHFTAANTSEWPDGDRIVMSKLGLGFESGVIVGMGFLMLFSVFMMPMDVMWLVVIVAGAILALAIMKVMGR